MLGAGCVVVPLASIGKPQALAEHECEFLSCSRQGKGIHESVYLSYIYIYMQYHWWYPPQPQNGKQRVPAINGFPYMCCISILHHFVRY